METRPWIRASSDISNSSALFPIEMILIFFPIISVQHKHITVCMFSILIFVAYMSKHTGGSPWGTSEITNQ